jgi:hypothetical protein
MAVAYAVAPVSLVRQVQAHELPNVWFVLDDEYARGVRHGGQWLQLSALSSQLIAEN